MRLGRIGLQWGELYRSQIFFVAFWVSLTAWALLAVSVASISSSPSAVTSVPFFQGTISFTNSTINEAASLKFYAGLTTLVVADCTDGIGLPTCPPHIQSWTAVSCDQYLKDCSQCASSSVGTVSTVVFSFIGQIAQLATDLHRSTGKSNMNNITFVYPQCLCVQNQF